jgi:hypothetical protein
MKSYGMSERYVLEKDKKHRPKQSFNKMEWTGDYDGNKAHVDIQLNNNGHREHMNMVLNNNDLIEILNIPEVNIPIHQRLQNDFLLKNPNPNNQSFSPLVLENLIKTRKYRNINRYKKRHHKRSMKKSNSYKDTSSYRSSSRKSHKSSEKSKKMEKLLSLH